MDMSLMCNSTTADPKRPWCIKTLQLNHMVMCYKQSFTRTEGLWRAENATNYSVPTFLLQLILIITVNRLLMTAFRYLRLPRIAAEILGGGLLGATGLANTLFAKEYVYPYRSIMTLETVANLALLYYMFLVGLEVDIKPIVQAPKKAFSVALAGFLVPFPVGYALHYLMVDNFDTATENLPTRHGPLFWGLALCTTNFPDLAQILSDLKLLHSEVGRSALSAAVITDFISWLLLVVAMAIVNNGQVYTVVFAAAFVAASLLALRPALAWAVRRTSKAVEAAGGYNDYHISLVLALVVACGYATDACGCHSIFGGFMLGLVMPKGDLKEKLMEKIEDFVSGLMMPLFFVIIGLRTNLNFVFGKFGAGTILAVFALVFLVKIVTTFLAAVFMNKMKVRDGLALGVLMNTKGLLTLIVLSTARDLKVLNNETFAMLLMPLWVMTVVVGPTLRLTYKSGRPGDDERRSTIESLEPHSELRILTCFHNAKDATGIVNLLDASNPTRDSPVSVSAVHLVENVGRASAMLIVHDTCCTDNRSEVSTAFDALESAAVSVETLTAVSAYATMHVDVCGLAREKRATLVLLPFYLKPGDPLRSVNRSVMDHAECSVAVLVDRGHRPRPSGRGRERNFLLMFVGGPDDREALAYAGRMGGAPGLGLTVARFVPGGEPEESAEKTLDERCVDEFRRRTKGNKMVRLTETAVESGDEIVKMINTVDGDEFDLIIVGKGRTGREVRLDTGSASDWSEYPELGSLGDSLVCSSFAAGAWILVVQQGGGGGPAELLDHTTWQPREFDKHDLAPFVCALGNKGC